MKAMELGVALETVHAMATALYRRHGEICQPARCPADAEAALAVVEDFVVHEFGVEDVDTAGTPAGGT